MCLSTGGGVSGPGGGVWLGGVAWWRPPRTATAAGGTHPTGVHSCIGIMSFHYCMFPKKKKLLQKQKCCKKYPATTLIYPFIFKTFEIPRCWRLIPCVKKYFNCFEKIPVYSLSGKMEIQIPCSTCAVTTSEFVFNPKPQPAVEYSQAVHILILCYAGIYEKIFKTGRACVLVQHSTCIGASIACCS